MNSTTLHKTISPTFSKLESRLIELFESLKDQPDHVLNKKPAEGKWSILQIMYHLILVEEASIAYCKKKLSFNPEIKKGGIMTKLRMFALSSYVVMPIKAKAPGMVNEDHMPEEMRFWEVVKKWKDIRKEAKDFLSSLPADMMKKEVYKHPVAGRLTLVQMINFWEGHFNRHRRQIKKIMDKEGYVS